jgi:hypothetical protein
MDQLEGNTQNQSLENQLDALFRAYAEACPAPEPKPEFMPLLWQRIEARQTFTFSFRRMANALVTAAMAASIALGVYMALPHGASSNPSLYSSYVEVLANSNANTIDTPDIVAPVRLDLSEAQ